MGSRSKQQAYPYSLKTVAASEDTTSLMSGLICGNRFFMYMLPPKDALTIERLFCHFVFQFDASISAGDRVVRSIGIVDEIIPFSETAESNYQRRQELNISADANRRVDISMDLTHLLKNDDVGYEESGFDPNPVTTGYTLVEILLDQDIPTLTATGVVELWKIDGLFTTIGIR